MRYNQTKKNSFFSKQPVIFLIGIIILTAICFPIYKKYRKQADLGAEINDLRTEISRMENKKNELNDVISYLESDQFVELEARKKLNYMKEGEEMVIVKSGETGNENKPDIQSRNRAYLSLPQKWLRHFFN